MSRTRPALRPLKGPEALANRTDAATDVVPVAAIDEVERLRLREELKGVDELAADIAKNTLLYPLIIRPSGKRFELISGYRRLAALKKLGRTEAPVRVMALDDDQALRVAVAENEQRETLTETERLRVIRQLHEEGKKGEEIAEVFGWARRNAFAHLAVATKAPAAVLEALRRERITFSTALAVVEAKLPEDADLSEVLEELAKVSVREAKDVLELAKGPPDLWAGYRAGAVRLPVALAALEAAGGKALPWGDLMPRLGRVDPEDVPELVESAVSPGKGEGGEGKTREAFKAFRWDARVPAQKGFTLHVNFRVVRAEEDARAVIKELEKAIERVRKVAGIGGASTRSAAPSKRRAATSKKRGRR